MVFPQVLQFPFSGVLQRPLELVIDVSPELIGEAAEATGVYRSSFTSLASTSGLRPTRPPWIRTASVQLLRPLIDAGRSTAESAGLEVLTTMRNLRPITFAHLNGLSSDSLWH